jgi:hypothetical protein
MLQIAVINESTATTDGDVQGMIPLSALSGTRI